MGENDDHRRRYLYRIATNLLRDHFRRTRQQTDEVPGTDEARAHDEVIHLGSDVGGAMAEIDLPLPDPAPIWLRARLATRERGFHRATRAIVWVQGMAVAVALAIGAAFAPQLWRVARGLFSGLDLSAPIADLPRSTGLPLLVIVMSLTVLGALAFWELAAAHENRSDWPDCEEQGFCCTVRRRRCNAAMCDPIV